MMYSEDFYIQPQTDILPRIYQQRLDDIEIANRKLDSFSEPEIDGPELQEFLEQQQEEITEPVPIPMPFIQGDPTKKGPIVVTKDWYVREKKKRLTAAAKTKKQIQIEMMDLIAQRDYLMAKLSRLRPHKKKDMAKVVELNVDMRDLQARLELLESQSGLKVEELAYGTRWQRRLQKAKDVVRRGWKKVKKFFRRNRDTIIEIATIAIPVLVAGIATSFLNPSTANTVATAVERAA